MTNFNQDPIFTKEIDPETEWMDINEVMRLLGISRPTLYRYLKRGAPCKRSGGDEPEIGQIQSIHKNGKRYWSRTGYMELKKILDEKKGFKCPACGKVIR